MASYNLLDNFLCFRDFNLYPLFQHSGGLDRFSHIPYYCLHDSSSLYLSYYGKEDLPLRILYLHTACPFINHGQLDRHVLLSAGPFKRFASCQSFEVDSGLTSGLHLNTRNSWKKFECVTSAWEFL